LEFSDGSNESHPLNVRMCGFGEIVYTLRSVNPETQELRL